MKSPVVDAGVVAGLFFQESCSSAIERSLQQTDELLAPDLLWAEVANVIWKRHRRGEISNRDAAGIAEQVTRLPIQSCPDRELAGDALQLAMEFDRTVCDCLYLALAMREDTTLLTADKRLSNALTKTPASRYVCWVGT